jgi:hypothetical protein
MFPEPADHDRLQDAGDDLIVGRAGRPPSDDEQALKRTLDALAETYKSASAMPAELKQSIWEDLMTTATLESAVSITGLTPRESSAGRPTSTPRRLANHRWQAPVSLALVFLLLISATFVAITINLHQQGAPNDSNNAALNAVQPGNGDDSAAKVPGACIANGKIPSNDELLKHKDFNWTQPHYSPAYSVTQQRAQDVQQTYLNYLRCYWDGRFAATPPGNSTPMAAVERQPKLLTYFSDQLRYERLPDVPAGIQKTIQEYQCFPRFDDLLDGFPLPVNRPVTNVMVNGDLMTSFAPSDVFRLPDGRFGAMTGTISTAALTDPAAVSTSDSLSFVAFTEVGDHYYIDEFFTVVSADMDKLTASGWNGMLRTDCGS